MRDLWRMRSRQMQLRHARVVRPMHDARVPTIHILHAAVLGRYLSHDLLESQDGLAVVRDVELSHDGGFGIIIAFTADFGGNHEDAAPCSAADEVFCAGRRRGAAPFDSWRRGEYQGARSEREQGALPFCIMMLNISVISVGSDMVDSCRDEMHRISATSSLYRAYLSNVVLRFHLSLFVLLARQSLSSLSSTGPRAR